MCPADEQWAAANAGPCAERILIAPAPISVAGILASFADKVPTGRAMPRLNALINVMRLNPNLSFGVDSRMWLTVRAADPLPFVGSSAPASASERAPTEMAASAEDAPPPPDCDAEASGKHIPLCWL